MTEFKFSHRATGLPGGNPETDRVGLAIDVAQRQLGRTPARRIDSTSNVFRLAERG
jgi:hypothetical protein